MRIAKKLKTWKENGLINEETEQSIIAFESSSVKKFNLFAICFMVIGILFVLLGVIYIVAYNWHIIPSYVKIAALLLILMLFGFFILKANKDERTLLKEGCILFFAGLIAANIALIAQVYHLDSDWTNGVALWCILAFPLLLIAGRAWLIWFWIPSVVLVIFKNLAGIYDWGIFSFYLAFAVLAIILLTLAFVSKLLRQAEKYSGTLYCYGFIAIFLSIILYEIASYAHYGYIPGIIHSLAVLAAVLIYLYKTGRPRLFNLCFVLLSVRVAAFCLEKFYSQFAKGVVFIVLGLVLFGMFKLWGIISGNMAGKKNE